MGDETGEGRITEAYQTWDGTEGMIVGSDALRLTKRREGNEGEGGVGIGKREREREKESVKEKKRKIRVME